MSDSSISSTIFWLLRARWLLRLHLHAGASRCGSSSAPACARPRSRPRRRGSCRRAAGRPCSKGAGISTPWRWAALRMVSPSKAWTVWPSSVKATVGTATSASRAGAFIQATSCGKYFCTQRTGFGAAWPRPQIDASRHHLRSDPRASRGPTPAPPSARAALAVPTRQGVHWPQLSCAKKRIMLSAASRALSCWPSTMTAAEPMKQPCGCSVSKSSGMSARLAGRMPPEAPPGR